MQTAQSIPAPAPVPDSVRPDLQALYAGCNSVRARIKEVAGWNQHLRKEAAANAADGETIANITLAYRHLEDASMRLGKALQALDGGVSVYDKATTVGA